MCGLLFSCNGKNSKEKPEETPSNEISNEPVDTQTYEKNEQGLAFYLLDDDTYGVGIGNAIYLSNIVIPATFNCKSVSKVVSHGFFGNVCTKTIIMPDTIVEIDTEAFSALNNLTSIRLSKNLKKIGQGALSGDKLLKEISYDGTMEEFNKIDFGENWLLDYEVGTTFVFKDKRVELESLYELELYRSNNNRSNSQKYNESIELSANCNCAIGIFCFYEIKMFGKISKIPKNVTMQIEDETIVEIWDKEIMGSHYPYDGDPANGFYLHMPGKVGTTKVNFSYAGKTASLTFIAIPDIQITISGILDLIDSIENIEDRNYEYPTYSFAAYVYSGSIVNPGLYNLYVKDDLSSDLYIRIKYFESETEIAINSRLHFIGATISLDSVGFYIWARSASAI